MRKLQPDQKKQISLLTRILIYIGIPILIIYCISSAITLYGVNKSITGVTKKQLISESEAAANEVAGVFTKYMEITKQMSVNSQFEDTLLELQPGMAATAAQDRDKGCNRSGWSGFYP